MVISIFFLALSHAILVYGGIWQKLPSLPKNNLPRPSNPVNSNLDDNNLESKRPRGLKLFWKDVEDQEKKVVVTIRKRYTPMDMFKGMGDDIRWAVPQIFDIIVNLPFAVSTALRFTKLVLVDVAKSFKTKYDELLPAVRLVLGLNYLIYLGWWFLPRSFMDKYFTFREIPFRGNLMDWIKDVIRDPLWFTKITAAFSHYRLHHLLLNTEFLISQGNGLCLQLGSITFLLSIVSAGVFSLVMNDLMTIGVNQLRSKYFNLEQAVLPPKYIGFSGITYTLAVLAASIRVPNKYISNDNIDEQQKNLRQAALTEFIFYLFSKFGKPLPIAYGVHLSGIVWGFILSDWFYRQNKL